MVSFVRRISELKNYPVDTGRKLNVNKTFRRRYWDLKTLKEQSVLVTDEESY